MDGFLNSLFQNCAIIISFIIQGMADDLKFNLCDNESSITPLPLPFSDQLMFMAICDDRITPDRITPETNFDILLNKHLNNHEITDVELQQLPEHQRNVFEQIQNKCKEKKKRPDECQKLFYKRAFKYSEGKYFKRCKNKSRKMSHFYHYHFDQISKCEGLPITHFYHPNKKTKPGLIIGHKTFNNRYVKLLLKSKSFLEDTREYHNMFIDDCMRERERKINSFTTSLQRIMNRADEDTRLIVKHLQSSQCKIPWTDTQIKQTWQYAKRDLAMAETLNPTLSCHTPQLISDIEQQSMSMSENQSSSSSS